MMYVATGNAEFKNRVNYIVDELREMPAGKKDRIYWCNTKRGFDFWQSSESGEIDPPVLI